MTNFLDRKVTLDRCEQDLDYRAWELEKCRRDPIYWINNWVWTTDPRNPSRGLPVSVPFVLWPKQVEYLQWRRGLLKDRKFGIVAKSRDSGMSWILVADQLHHWLFESDYKGAIGSRKNQLVDRLGDPDTIFQKFRMILDKLPYWMKPESFQDNYMRLINDSNRSVISGEGGDNLGRGGRSSCYDVDEFAFVERQPSVLAALSANTDCLILTSTPNGVGNEFANIYLQDRGYSKFTFHWLDDERKNNWIALDGSTGQGRNAPIGAIYPFYEDQKSKLDPLILAKEVDIDFNSSMEGILIESKWVMAAIDFPLISSSFTNQAGFDVASSGKCLNTFIVVQGGNRVSHIESWSEENTTISAYKAIDLCRAYNVDKFNYDICGIGAGVSSTLALADQSKVTFAHEGINGGSSPSDFYWTDESRSSKDKYANRRIELWDYARQKFKNTYEMRHGIAKHSLDECISIPNHQQLIQELSTPVLKYRSDGKLLLESKQDMAKRNVKSPDFADALAYALARDTRFNFTNSNTYY